MASVSNRAVASLLGLSESGVSRLRTGNRRPSIRLINTIEAKLGWPCADQIRSANNQTYHQEFERVLLDAVASGTLPAPD